VHAFLREFTELPQNARNRDGPENLRDYLDYPPHAEVTVVMLDLCRAENAEFVGTDLRGPYRPIPMNREYGRFL